MENESKDNHKFTLAELRKREAKLMREEGHTNQEISEELGKRVKNQPHSGKGRV